MLTDRSPTVLRPPTSLLSQAMAQVQAESASASPASSRSRHAASLSTPSFRLENLPRFHPAVYQSATGSSSTVSAATFDFDSVTGTATSSHIYSRPQTYRPSSASAVISAPSASSSTAGSSSRDALRQYRDLVAGMALSARASAQSSSFSKPSKPRLEPLGSPGPVTPLALEEEGEGYLSAGTMDFLAAEGQGQGHAGIRERTELLDRLIMREQDRIASRIH
ncbi:hypothetical protein MGYG_00738 [Nannizzia gypsea CBS 118893]|uniref:Uncharacterized protein n=1 Tax=Arthroderma gypseum (strain ATCC MYA-4604 / CBS 118893) TaxID=535722 RepID=E5R1E8_ARTGP|nr:hypothetical protein MGYG_00738 [Nannizzia gypsea CBS 118893]EFQ97699.1 hypothetical protein MGYG_00738 [Nannizzia gypsea CBS 118893]